MSRRPLQPPIGRLAKAQNRMAPGGLLWSESPIPRRYTPRGPAIGDDAPEPLPPEPVFPLPELVFSGGQVTNSGTTFFAAATWDGTPLAMTGGGAWVAIPGTAPGYTIEVAVNTTLMLWTGAVRLTNGTGYASRFYSTLADAAGTGADVDTLTKITRPGAPFQYYVHQSTDPAVPSLSLSGSQGLAVYQFWGAPAVCPPSGRVPLSGGMRVSLQFGPPGPWPPTGHLTSGGS